MDTITGLKEKLQELKNRMSKESGRTRKITNSDIATVHSQIREMENMEWRCICGKQIPEGTIYCSDRCAWIAEKMDTPLGRQRRADSRRERSHTVGSKRRGLRCI